MKKKAVMSILRVRDDAPPDGGSVNRHGDAQRHRKP